MLTVMKTVTLLNSQEAGTVRFLLKPEWKKNAHISVSPQTSHPSSQHNFIQLASPQSSHTYPTETTFPNDPRIIASSWKGEQIFVSLMKWSELCFHSQCNTGNTILKAVKVSEQYSDNFPRYRAHRKIAETATHTHTQGTAQFLWGDKMGGWTMTPFFCARQKNCFSISLCLNTDHARFLYFVAMWLLSGNKLYPCPKSSRRA